MKRFHPFVKPGYNTKTGEIPIYIRYNYDRTKRTLIPIGYSIAHEYWDFKRNYIKKACPEFNEINDEIISLTGRLSNILTYAKENLVEPTINFVLLELAKNREYDFKSKRVDLFEQLDKYIEEKTNRVTRDVIKDYNSLKKHLNGFKEHSSQPITFSALNSTFYDEFLDYLSYKVKLKDGTIGLKNNTVGKQIKNLKAFVRNRAEKKIIPEVDLKAFKRIEEQVDHIYLTEAELKRIYELDLSQNKIQDKVRDLFIVGCYTGLRYSDLSAITPANIDLNLGVIQLTQKKVNQPVTVPLIDYIPSIIDKYNLQLPKIPLNEFNREIKKIGALAGIDQPHIIVRKKGTNYVKQEFKKHELIHSHTCRRSFCTNMYLSGFPAEELMKISGHKTATAFLTYIKIDNFQAAVRLKDLREKLQRG
ncbi:MAG: tyrosine-type recombinase/integrase [Bacteroidales bacterium]|nr:tyrosine-type recombinase/integrase [Bacteroidales bacterium]